MKAGSPAFEEQRAALEVVVAAIKQAGYKPGKDVFIALDPASSEFYDAASKKYVFKKSDGSKHTAAQMIEFYRDLCRSTRLFPLKMVWRRAIGTAGIDDR